MTNNQSILFVKNLLLSVFKEFKAVITPNSNPGLTLIPMSLFLFILCNNAFGLSPYIFTASRHITFTLTIAVPLWIGHMLLGATKTPNSILAHLVPLGTPPALMPFIVLIELTRRLIRPLTLSVRLAANIIAGHLLLSLIAGQASSLSLIILRGLITGLILLCTLECAVRIIQAYVFSILSSLYLNEVNRSALN